MAKKKQTIGSISTPTVIASKAKQSVFRSDEIAAVTSWPRNDETLGRKIFRYLTLFSIKEIYLSCRNFLGLILHPFKTITVLSREKDPVQILLIFGLPFYFWLGGLLAIIIGRILIAAPLLHFGPLAVLSIFLISFLSGLIFAYLAFWALIFLRKNK